MRAGLLRERVTIMRLVTVSTESTTTTEWQQVCGNIPARLVHLRGDKHVEAGEVITDFMVQFEFWYYMKDRLKSSMRIYHKDDKYQILNINPRRERQDVAVTCRIIEENDGGGN